MSAHHYAAASDACDGTAGFFIAGRWSYYDFKGQQRDWHINIKEAHAVLVLLNTYKEHLAGKRLRLFVDNQVVVFAWAKHWSPSRLLMSMIFQIALILIEYRIGLWIEWVSTTCNRLADMLSRKDLQGFKAKCRALGFEVDSRPTPVVLPRRDSSSEFLREETDKEELERFLKFLMTPADKQPQPWWY